MSDEVTRRSYLQALLATGVVASTAGCNSSQDTSNTEATDTPTATSSQAPRILAHDATPQDSGATLAVSLEGEDDHKLNLVRIKYGERTIEKNPESTSVRLRGEFTDLGASELTEAPGQVTFLLRDSTDRETRTEVYPDETPPRLQTFSIEPTDNAGELTLRLEGQDDIGLETIKLQLGERIPLQRTVSERNDYATDQRIRVGDDAAFQQHTATAILEDWNGNTTESNAETYVPKYDVLRETRLDIGAVYLPWMGSKFGGILSQKEVKPRIGYYEDLVERQNEVVNQHVDQMRGHGINKIMFTFGERNDHQRFNNFEQAHLSKGIGVEAFVAIPPIFDRGRDIDEDLDFIRENLLGEPYYSTTRKRPIVQFWNPSHLVYNRREQIRDEYGGLTDFLRHVRKKLRKDGTDPFLVGDANGRGYNQGDAGFGGAEDFWGGWDGLTSWTGRTVADETVSQEKAMRFVEEDYQKIREFADKNDQEFYPMVIPGFNDTHNEEWGQNRTIPRSTTAFRDRLQLAEKYADGRINIYSFNEWAEGSQIESGRFLDNDYGTAYLEVVEEFQTSN
jgi:hypothetical protein